MLRPFLLALIGLIALPSMAAAETPITITIKDPTQFETQLREMGYAPGPFKVDGTTAITALHLPNATPAIVAAGCSAGRNCTYVVLIGSFADVNMAPAAWVAKMNAHYDLIKVWNRDDGRLAYAASAVVEDEPRSTFRAWIDRVISSSNDLGREAIKAGLGPNKQ